MLLERWRTSAATWGGAAWLILQQFGVPGEPASVRETRIVRVEDAERSIEASETLRDGRILTMPLEVRPRHRQDGRVADSFGVSPN
jgi:hypothetical protein